MLVKEILELKGKALYTIAPDKSLQEAVATMVDQDVGSLVVFEKGRMAGLLAFREVLQAVRKHADIWASLKVAEVMQVNPHTAGPNVEVDELRRMMLENRARYVPIIDGSLLLGVVTFFDVAKAVLDEKSYENNLLKDYISR